LFQGIPWELVGHLNHTVEGAQPGQVAHEVTEPLLGPRGPPVFIVLWVRHPSIGVNVVVPDVPNACQSIPALVIETRERSVFLRNLCRSLIEHIARDLRHQAVRCEGELLGDDVWRATLLATSH
jgi:hypothetical protein